MGDNLVLTEFLTEEIVLIKINRPKSLNALNAKLLERLYEELQYHEKNQNIASVIITGTGKAFVAGADIDELRNMTCEEAKDFSQRGNEIFNYIENYGKPVIAALNGYTLGGGLELTLSCDIRIAAENAIFGFPEIKLGVIPGFGGTQRLAKVVGIAIAKEMIYTGKMIDVHEAEKYGLVNKVVANNELMNTVKEIAHDIAKKSRFAIKQAKETINKGFNQLLQTGLCVENKAFSLCFSTYDQKEGMAAFLEKRKPIFNKKSS